MRVSKFNLASLIVGYAFLYIPIFFLVAFSFNASKNPGIWTGFSLQWYVELFENTQLVSSAINSFKIAIISASLSAVIGTTAAIIHIRLAPNRIRQILNNFLIVPIATPEVVIAVGLLLTITLSYKLLGVPKNLGTTTIIIAHTTLSISYVYMMIYNRLKDFDIFLEEAALDLGASPIQVFLQVTLPVIFPSIVSGWLLALALSLDDIVLASFLSGPGSTTLPILIFSQIRMGISPAINALATIIIFVLFVSMIFFQMLQRKQ